MKITDYLNNSKKIEITVTSSVGEETFWVEYKPNAWTYQASETIKDLTGFDNIAMYCEILIKDWSLTDSDGAKIPINVEGMKKCNVPYNLLGLIFKSINQDIHGNSDEEESKND